MALASLRPATLVLLLASLAAGPSALAQKFQPDDPVSRDRDDLHVPKVPGSLELATSWDVVENTFLRDHPKRGHVPPARNVNTLGEVPDSSWWTNRIGARTLSIAELVRGPNRGDGPDVDGTWTVTRGKTGGITPGFTARDSRGDVYFIKLDPSRYFGLSSGADLMGSKFFHAFGYFVPETWVVYLKREQIQVGPDAKIKLPGKKPRRMAASDLERILADVAALPDGRLRFVASKALPGRVVGPHKYYGTRPDDPNDVIPHEDRRELRGYRVFCAWLNHDDSRAANSLDTYVSEEGRSFLRHYMQDFSSMLGSGSDWRRVIAPQNPRAGNEYVVEWGPLLKTAFSLGLWERPWYGVKYQVYPQVGAIESAFFDPDRWKPEYPNAAFESMLPADAFWAARIVSRFGDEAIRAIVAEADLRAPEAEEHLARTIIERRDKILGRYFRGLNPLADFRLEDSPSGRVLAFTNHGTEAGLGVVEAYEYQWFRFDNATGKSEPLAEPARASQPVLPVPAEPAEYLMARVRTLASGIEAWHKRIDVVISTGAMPRVVGVEREE